MPSRWSCREAFNWGILSFAKIPMAMDGKLKSILIKLGILAVTKVGRTNIDMQQKLVIKVMTKQGFEWHIANSDHMENNFIFCDAFLWGISQITEQWSWSWTLSVVIYAWMHLVPVREILQ